MIKQILDLSKVTPLNRMQIEHLVHLSGKFSSHIFFENQNRTINGKSMLGLLSMGVTGDTPVTLVVDGEDEEQAALEIRRLLDNGVAPPKDGADAEKLMQEIKRRYADLLQEDLLGIYLHGSLAAGCFQWECSDIDFLVVVRRPLAIQKKIALVEALYSLREEAPPEGFEMTVLTADACKAGVFPMPYVLRYSSRLDRDYNRAPRSFCERMNGEDVDMAIHVMSLYAYGAVLLGPSVPRVFAKPQKEDVLWAIRNDASKAGEKLHERPVYYVLNLCRSLAYLREGLTLSKRDGGEWALRSLPKCHQGVIQAALNAYNAGRDMFYDQNQAEDFCYDAVEELTQ